MDARLLEFARTKEQREAVDAVLRLGSVTKAGREIGIVPQAISSRISRVIEYAKTRGYDPKYGLTNPCSDMLKVDRVSTLYNKDGEVSGKWVVASKRAAASESMIAAVVEEMKASIKRAKPTKSVKVDDADLLNLYVIADAHIGMLAHHEETGENWDTKIGEQALGEGIEFLAANSPKAKIGFLAQIGDGLHSDGIAQVTPRSGHLLDQDGRFHKVVRAATRVFRGSIERLLQKHEKVIVLMLQGNHDPASSIWLQELFSALYENEPRVEVIISPSAYQAYVHGNAFLGFHHGHGRAPVNRLVDTFVARFRQQYGNAKWAYLHTGHKHSNMWLKDSGHCFIEQHATVIPKDAYASMGGWESDRLMHCISYSADSGREKFRCTFHPEPGVE